MTQSGPLTYCSQTLNVADKKMELFPSLQISSCQTRTIIHHRSKSIRSLFVSRRIWKTFLAKPLFKARKASRCHRAVAAFYFLASLPHDESRLPFSLSAFSFGGLLVVAFYLSCLFVPSHDTSQVDEHGP